MDRTYSSAVTLPLGSGSGEPIVADEVAGLADLIQLGAERLEGVSALLMAMQRHWNEPDREQRLALTIAANREVWRDIRAALADASLALPLDVQQRLLILSVYADGKLDDCEASPSADKLGSLLALTRKLAGNLREWKAAA
jgi:hypothetical protein